MASNENVPTAAWYLNKACECERLARNATSPDERTHYENEAVNDISWVREPWR